MAAKIFSKKEAISHGFKMTKKYFGLLFSIFLIYLAFETISGILHYLGGSPVTKASIRAVYRESAAAENFQKYLEETGYISKYSGVVQEKLQNIKSASELVLSADWEADRDDIFQMLNRHRYHLPFPKVIFYLLAIALWALGVIIQIGCLRITLLLSRDQKPALRELFSNGYLFWSFVLGSICYGLAVAGGILLLIIPGIIFSVMLGMYPYLIVDKNMGPIEALKASRILTNGARWQLFWFGGLLILLNIGGFLCLLIGLFFTIPVSYIASAYVYDQLRKQDEIATA